MKPIQIGFQGARGAFSHRAGQMFVEQSSVAQSAQFAPMQSFEEVFRCVTSGGCDFGALPLENSSVGSIVANYDLLWKNDVLIEAEILLPVRHQLLGFPGTKLEDLEAIYSHPVALDQCRIFLKSLPKVKAISSWDTSGSAFFVKESGNGKFAAIASELAAQESGLTILQKNVEDHHGNNTRFGIIRKSGNLDFEIPHRNGGRKSSSLNVASPQCNDAYKLSCAAELPHTAGSLAKLLMAIADLGVNVTKIESRPIPETPWHYRFFLDIELKSSSNDGELVKRLTNNAEKCKILGRYQNWTECADQAPATCHNPTPCHTA